ncbi:hypothetical protein PFICI_09703 [Pestalotiopsis fici W106-1]|uniref:Malonyl-CoA:ACP transacylase (MAT) domain-containing protein n=1 Tax=Pestalotiopsis fici (strain W106-1 / CGMCC3.15140) TaxID=1229662 RepID=W3WXM6_PESFW|nr:uncharacterized protein PFICI_09703 [Pestalotiopsis fici W106-1]ETS77641.1 hypothetical protein PFICI_09703 [Pestalotiopsis fici W106-1]
MTTSEEGTSSFDEVNPTPKIFDTPGLFTPVTPGVLVQFSISFQQVHVEFTLPASDASQLNESRRTFLATLDQSQSNSDGKASISAAVLAFQFLEYLLTSRVSLGTLARVFDAVQSDILRDKEIHDFLNQLDDGISARKYILRTYMVLVAKLSIPLPSGPSAFISAATREKHRILVTFGGQSSANPNCVDDLADLYSIYQPYLEPLVTVLGDVLNSLSRHHDTKAFYLGREIDLAAWLADPATRPSKSFISGAAVSFPIIGLTGLLHYSVICQLLGKTPAEMAQTLAGTTGHSQGIILATAVAKAHSWESFLVEAKWAMEMLFWIGYESQLAAPQSALSPAMINDNVQNGEGIPSHMLLVRGMGREKLDGMIAAGNKYLSKDERLHLSLINSSADHVVAGPPKSLRGLVLRLRQIRAKDGLDQSRVPYSKRKPVISLVFLPVNAPFHTPYLREAADRVSARMSRSWPDPARISDLRIPVFDTESGLDMRMAYRPEADMTHLLIDAVSTKVVDWPKTLQVDNGPRRFSHIITLGAGRFAGMVHQNVDGRGVRVIDGTKLDTADLATTGDKAEMFAQEFSRSSTFIKSWKERFRPRLVQSADGDYRVETRLNKILKAHPIIVAGMTPTTVPWDFVASVTDAGYHIELAGGGYHNAAAMTSAIEKLAANIPVGRSITCNLIYVDPKAIGYQIPLIRQLISNGLPIRGLTIGAGVPSSEVAAQYIETLGIEHISFKPGSIGAIRDVISIAKAHPTFPIILQWTGGRGGGHHSCEDFHQPLLETYSEIRRCSNLYLVVGSGFGDGKGMLPYLTGSWSVPFGRPEMPCDGILLGSRMMVATDSNTSPSVKKVLVKASGVNDSEWEQSYEKTGAAGVLTVTSEMGQPIHKVATRGVRLWKEMDDTIFSLPKSERRAALLKRKSEIIKRLNEDYAKPWFGQDAAGHAADLEDMTYAEVLDRLVNLMYVAHQKRWVHPSYHELVHEFVDRTLERLYPHSVDPSLLENAETLISELKRLCPEITEQILHPEDARAFVQACKLRGRKPVNFVVAFDDDFEHWFKKDSLWQSEDIEAVIDQDPERVCILQSPVSVRYSTRDDQSSKEILDEIQNDLVALMQAYKDSSNVKLQATLPVAVAHPISNSIIIDDMAGSTAFKPVSGQDLPGPDDWIECLEPYTCPSVLALLEQDTLFETSTNRSRPNPFRRIFSARHGYTLILDRDCDQMSLQHDDSDQTIVRVTAASPDKLQVQFVHGDHVPTGVASLTLQLKYDARSMQLIDCTDNRNRRIQDFYAQLWLGQGEAQNGRLTDRFFGGSFELTQKLQQTLSSVVSHAMSDGSSIGRTNTLPLETGVIASWDVLMTPLLISDLDGDILRLVHQSIGIEYTSGAAPLQVGDSINSESSIRSVTIQPSGKSVVVEAKLLRESRHIGTVTSEFFIKGSFSDHHNTFRYEEEPVMELKVESKIDEAVLRDRSWLRLDDACDTLSGKTLIFKTQTRAQWLDHTKAADLMIRGTVEHMLWNGSRVKVGSIYLDATRSLGNPVMDFLQRKGRVIDAKVMLKNPGWAEDSERTVIMPSHTQLYAETSGDCNPIHVSPVFADLAELPCPIMHGMYTAAVSRKVVEDLVVPGEPQRMRRFNASFVGMVRPGDHLIVGFSHVAMNNGRMVLKVTARQEETGEEVLRGEAEVDQPSTAYLFTGQGSQSPGMGMGLYETSPVAKAIYDEMDSHIRDTYGWSILQVIRENPKELTVHFRGRQGQKILQNYLDMRSEVTESDGTRRSIPIIPGLSRDSTSHTFSDARGLLQSTLFAQPAIILLEKATFEHMRESGLIQEGALFAGHSLGEYGALSSLAGFVSFKDMLSICLYRGLIMQLAVPRNHQGYTGYSMMAANPARVGKHFDDAALRQIVRHIHRESGELLEIVNFNIEGEQYVCAGHVQNLHCLTEILNAAAVQKIKPASIQEFLGSSEPEGTTVGKIIAQSIAQSKQLPLDVELRRGKATIPLAGIEVPFHSSRLEPGVPTWRAFLRDRIVVEDIRPERLVGSFIPNVVGKPFSLDSSFVQEVAHITQSPILERIVC